MNYDKILEKIRPRPEEVAKNNEVAKQVINEINKQGYEAVLVGSSARGTFLTGSRDLDIFVFFPKNVTRERLEELGVNLGKEVLKKYHPKVHYAEHPYVKGIADNIEVEIVPCYKIEKGENIISAVDRSPLHHDFMKKSIKGLEDQVLLLKQFLKAQKCYGAEQKIDGFSGVLAEYLIVNYKTFDKLIKDVAENWGVKIAINCKEKDKHKYQDQLVVIDPVDSNRNMAAAVSRKTLSRFILAARKFLKNPSEEFFFPKKKDINFRKELKRNLVLVTFAYPGNVVEEIIWSQLKKLCEIVKEKLNDEGFQVLRSFYWTDEERECDFIFEIDSFILNKYKKHKGPEVFEAEHLAKFIEKNGQIWFERNRAYAWQRRKFVRATDFLKNLMMEMPLPSHLKNVGQRARILQGRDLKRYPKVVEEFFDEIL